MISILGIQAEERGRDAAGGAVLSNDGWEVRKQLGAFQEMDDQPLGDLLGTGQAVIGHTRWATQGWPDLTNAGPVVVGQTIGSHNGDLDPDSLPATSHVRLAGASDSRRLFAVLDQIRATADTAEDVTGVLSSIHGRAALAWTHTGDKTPTGVARSGRTFSTGCGT